MAEIGSKYRRRLRAFDADEPRNDILSLDLRGLSVPIIANAKPVMTQSEFGI